MKKLTPAEIKDIEMFYHSHIAAAKVVKKMLREYKFKHLTFEVCTGKCILNCKYCFNYFKLVSKKRSNALVGSRRPAERK